MPESLPDAFDAPILATAGGVSYELPLMEFDDLSALGRQVFAEIKAQKLRKLPLTATQEQREGITRFYDDQEADVDTLGKWVFTMPGTRAFLRLSLKKLNVPQVDADKWIYRHARENGWRDGTAFLAARVSALFPPIRDAAKAGPAGNPPAGEQQAAGETGSSAGVSSNESAASPQAA
jgi:hypothetical protein